MSAGPTFRVAQAEDIRPVYRMFRRSIFAYLHRIGLATAEEASSPPVESAWKRQSDWIGHLWATAAENWVATDQAGAIIGWALSVERSRHLELAFFFVDPEHGARGVGSHLLDLAFTSRPETKKTIMATQDPSALALYLRTGLRFVATACDIRVTGRRVAPGTDLVFRRIGDGPADLAVIAGIEERLIGLCREADLRFLAGNRPGWIALRDGRPVGYAFGAQPTPADATDFPPTCGPAAALDAADLPALIDVVINAAPAGSDLYFAVPLANQRAVSHLLRLGGRIDPFYIAVLSTWPGMALDRYIHTAPSFIV